MQKCLSKTIISLTFASISWQTSASAQVSSVAFSKHAAVALQAKLNTELNEKVTAASLNRVPKFREGLTAEQKREVVAAFDHAIDQLRDLPEVSKDVLSTVDHWETLDSVAKQAILEQSPFNGGIASNAGLVVTRIVAWAWDKYKEMKKGRWEDFGFDQYLTIKDMDYTIRDKLKIPGLDSLNSRLRREPLREQVSRGLNP